MVRLLVVAPFKYQSINLDPSDLYFCKYTRIVLFLSSMPVSLNIYTLVTNFVIINWKYDMHIKNLILFEHKFVTLNLCIIVVRVQKIQWRAWICQRISLYIFFRFSCSFVFFFLFFWISVAFLRTLNKTNSRTFRQKKSVNLRSAQRIRDDIICAASVFDAHSHKLHFAVKHGTPTRKKNNV